MTLGACDDDSVSRCIVLVKQHTTTLFSSVLSSYISAAIFEIVNQYNSFRIPECSGHNFADWRYVCVNFRQKKQTLLLTCMATGHWRTLRVVCTSFCRHTISRLSTNIHQSDLIMAGLMHVWQPVCTADCISLTDVIAVVSLNAVEMGFEADMRFVFHLSARYNKL